MISYRFAKIEDANQIADIHLQAFEDFFLTSLGLGFLKLYYKSAINFKGATTICAINENNKIIGFSMGSIISTNFHKKLILSNKLGFFIRVIIILFSNPKALNRLKKNLQKKADPNDDGDYAELLSIGVLPEFKGLGVGKGLLIEFERAVLNAGAKRISLTTDIEKNQNVVNFYFSMKFKVYYEFITYPNRKMYKLIKNL